MKKRQMNYENDKELTAKRLREAMDDLNITAAELSEMSKVHKASISQYLHAVQSPSNISASSLAKVLNVNPMWLMGFNVPKVDEPKIDYVIYSPTNEEITMLEKIRSLSKEDRDYINSTIDRLFSYKQAFEEILNQKGGDDNA